MREVEFRGKAIHPNSLEQIVGSWADWFLANDKSCKNWEAIGDVHPHLFFTGDLNKAKRIKAILEEEVSE
ncbi:TPA: hypothetical protein ACSKPT_002376 [Listeria innocua]|uniref:Uncharacterized protein n=1 Tax=Listeria seeligeri FSL N1-067 TaxID=702453 RepID=E3ZPR0_LISSE|nr:MULTISPECIES: hypothetical protein [Listeria]EDO1188682.1 hypothetical protein [Listeria innocua]EFS00386.1 conserved hypothetical protein [Listeria seeligeri FSL N1-067]EKY3975814.1 hypothetical protein [Listeria innocua]ELY0449843.1 hypothetical protein [Listeria innocua]ELY0457333.1 hypothetical protein [Listeria innocua]